MTFSIRNGATMLDARYPGWEEAINLDTLDLASQQTCVIGQVATWLDILNMGDNEYESGAIALGFEPYGDRAQEFGFWNPYKSNLDYSELTSRWKKAIKRRLNKGDHNT